MNVDYAGQTNTGLVRGKNEDSYLMGQVPGGHVLLVADGIGGHPGGEIASRLAVDTVFLFMQSGSSLLNAIKAANTAVYKAPPVAMGTTIVGAYIKGDRITLGHLGDSRAYCLRDGVLYILTQDHTPVGRKGGSAHSNMLLKAVGIEKSVEPTMAKHVMKRGDWYVLCSDGLYTEVNADSMASILTSSPKSESAASSLVDLAVENGGRDNVTAICLKVS